MRVRLYTEADWPRYRGTVREPVRGAVVSEVVGSLDIYEGDTIVRLGDIELISAAEFERVLEIHTPGDIVEVSVMRRDSREACPTHVVLHRPGRHPATQAATLPPNNVANILPKMGSRTLGTHPNLPNQSQSHPCGMQLSKQPAPTGPPLGH